MNINEAARALGVTRRAIRLYEEQGLLPPVARRENGYRDFSEADLTALRQIQLYRKLGVGLADIRRILRGEGEGVLEAVLERRRAALAADAQVLSDLEAFLRTGAGDPAALDEAVDYPTILDAIRAQLPGLWGGYVASHFAPYLQMRISTPEQKEAYQTILAFWDEPKRFPWSLRAMALLARLAPQRDAADLSAGMDARIQALLHPTPEQYGQMCAQVRRTLRLRHHPLVRYSPGEVFKRRALRALQACGYNDVFIPAMKRLSPAYRAYHDALEAIDARMRRDLGLHYDDRYHLVTHGRKDAVQGTDRDVNQGTGQGSGQN